MRGFTLIETVIYIALFSFLMAGVLTASADLIESTGKSNTHATTQEEGSFVMRKLEWALAGMTAAPTIGGSGCAQSLSITKTGATLNPVQFQYNSASQAIEMREGGSGAYSPLTTGNVSASCLQFTSIPATGSGPSGISAVATIGGLTFTVTKYLRQ